MWEKYYDRDTKALPRPSPQLFGPVDDRQSLSTGLCLGAVLPAQERFGEIIGLVSDPSGAAVPNVQVTITNKVTSRVLATQTGATGDYIFRNVDPGTYAIRFEAQGFNRLQVADVALPLGKTLRVNAPFDDCQRRTGPGGEPAPPLMIPRTAPWPTISRPISSTSCPKPAASRIWPSRPCW